MSDIFYGELFIEHHFFFKKSFLSHIFCHNFCFVVEKKHRENRKTLPWEHHIGCQMCQIALSKSAQKKKEKIMFFWDVGDFFNTVTAVTAVTTATFFLENFCLYIILKTC